MFIIGNNVFRTNFYYSNSYGYKMLIYLKKPTMFFGFTIVYIFNIIIIIRGSFMQTCVLLFIVKIVTFLNHRLFVF